jgi:hypothetical protein
MELIAEAIDRRYYLIRATSERDLSQWSAGDAFPCLLWDGGSDFSAGQREAIVRSLINAGCRYFVCGGHDSEKWEEMADEAFVDMTMTLSESEREARHIMTTSHNGESKDEVAFFFVFNTNFDVHDFKRYLVVTVGCDERSVNLLWSAVVMQAAIAAQPPSGSSA